MNSSEPITLTRDVEAAIIPVGTRVTLQKGETAYITQSLGGSYTVVVNGNMFRIEGKDADCLGVEETAKPVSTGTPVTQEHLEKEIWNQLRSCYDPEIPVNIYDLGLVYSVDVEGDELHPASPSGAQSSFKRKSWNRSRNPTRHWDWSPASGPFSGEPLPVVGAEAVAAAAEAPRTPSWYLASAARRPPSAE
jgi:hypothetical protein